MVELHATVLFVLLVCAEGGGCALCVAEDGIDVWVVQCIKSCGRGCMYEPYAAWN